MMFSFYYPIWNTYQELIPVKSITAWKVCYEMSPVYLFSFPLPTAQELHKVISVYLKNLSDFSSTDLHCHFLNSWGTVNPSKQKWSAVLGVLILFWSVHHITEEMEKLEKKYKWPWDWQKISESVFKAWKQWNVSFFRWKTLMFPYQLELFVTVSYKANFKNHHLLLSKPLTLIIQLRKHD